MDAIDFKYIISTNKIDSKTNINDLLKFAIDNLSHDCHSVRLACVIIIEKLSNEFIAKDIKLMQTRNETYSTQQQEKDANSLQSWHLLHKFETTIKRYDQQLKEHLVK